MARMYHGLWIVLIKLALSLMESHSLLAIVEKAWTYTYLIQVTDPKLNICRTFNPSIKPNTLLLNICKIILTLFVWLKLQV